MDIASPEENDDHVISVRKYKTLQEAIKKAVYIKIGMYNFFVILSPSPYSLSLLTYLTCFVVLHMYQHIS